ncbi:MAG: S-adenosylmethionine synthetase [Candidatus Deianiraeaceae bacterium]|jgi:S-adenosylmethionine synthetase
MKEHLFTSESVSAGHPDKICDIISDLVLDCLISKEHDARCAVECFATTNNLIIGGEFRLKNNILHNDELELLVRNKLKEIGCIHDGFAWDKVKITNLLHKQSIEIANGVDKNELKEEGAGDQGIMFGYACIETKKLMPAPIFYSHRILQELYGVEGLGPDAKSQVTFKYENGIPTTIDAVVISTQHNKGISLDDVRSKVLPVLEKVLPNMPNKDKTFINPAGTFHIGGPVSDAGLTGRKIIVDTYGGSSPHGGGAFSGKDSTKVDRSAAYIARYLAKNIVNAKFATRCTIQLSYAIGVSQPISIYVNTHGTGTVIDGDISDFILNNIDLSPRGIRQTLSLNTPIYSPTSVFGHFGRDFDLKNNLFLWERCDLKDNLEKWFNI